MSCVCDARGDLSAWKPTTMKMTKHTELPQGYWSVDRPRQLVLATCADYSPKLRGYAKNIFVIASSVDPATLQPFATG